MSFPPATEMFQFAGFASQTYGFSLGYRLRGGLPHSEIPGSPIARISPGLFAACRVLHRLSVPRHPPDALLQSSRATPNGKGHEARHCVSNAVGRMSTPAPDQVRGKLQPGPLRPGPAGVHPMRQTLFSRRHFVAGTAARPGAFAKPGRTALPLRSHNSLLYDCRQQRLPPPEKGARRQKIFAPRRPAPARGKPRWRCPGGGDRVRTDDLLLAKQALSRLSYTPLQGSGIRDQDRTS